MNSAFCIFGGLSPFVYYTRPQALARKSLEKATLLVIGGRLKFGPTQQAPKKRYGFAFAAFRALPGKVLFFLSCSIRRFTHVDNGPQGGTSVQGWFASSLPVL